MQADELQISDLLDLASTLHRAPPESVSDVRAAAPLAAPDPLRQVLRLLERRDVEGFICDCSQGADGSASLRFLDATDGFLHRLGYSREELQRLDVPKLTDARSSAGAARLAGQAVLLPEGPWPYVTRFGARGVVHLCTWEVRFEGRLALCALLREAEGAIRDLPAALVAWAPDGTITGFDTAAQRLLGRRREQVLGSALQNLLPASIRAREFAYLSGLVAGGRELESYRTILLGRGGRRVEVLLNLSPLQHTVGAGGVATLRPAPRVTSGREVRSDAGAALSGEWPWEQDESLRFTRHAGEGATLSRWMRSSVIGRSRQELPVLWASEGERAAHLLALARHEPFVGLELRLWDTEGGEHWLRVSGAPVFDAEGRFCGYHGVDREVSAERALGRAARIAGAQVALCPEPCLSWEPDGRISTCNEAAATLLGYAPTELRGRYVSLVLPAGAPGNAALALSSDPIPSLPVSLATRDGNSIPATLRTRLVHDGEGSLESIVAVCVPLRGEQAPVHPTNSFPDPAGLGIGVWNWALIGGPVQYDEHCANLLGLSLRELDGDTRPWGGRLHADDEERFDQALLEAISGPNGRLDLAVRLQGPQGQWQSVRLRASRVPAGNQHGHDRLVGLCEAADVRSPSPAPVPAPTLLQGVLEFLPAPAIMTDARGNRTWANSAARAQLRDEPLRLDELLPQARDGSVPLIYADASGALREGLLAPLGGSWDDAPGWLLILPAAAAPATIGAPAAASALLQRNPQAVAAWDAEGRVALWNHAAEALTGLSAEQVLGKRARIALLDQDEQHLPVPCWSGLFDALPDALVVLRADGGLEYANPASLALFGLGATETDRLDLAQLLLGQELIHLAQDASPAAWLRRLAGTRREATGRRRDGAPFPAELTVLSTGEALENRLLVFLRNISDRKYWENQLYWFAYTDSHTGLPNRVLLRDRLEHALATAARNRGMVGVLALEVRGIGHPAEQVMESAEDSVLRELGARVRASIREIDTVARLRGGQFAVVLPQIRDGAAAEAVAQKLLATLGTPLLVDGREVPIVPALGISVSPRDGEDADSLLLNADQALRQALAEGLPLARFFSIQANAG